MSRTILISSLLFLAACGGSTIDSSDDAGAVPTYTEGEGGDPLTYCTAMSWPGPDAERTYYKCKGNSGQWTCTCGSSPAREVEAELCGYAMEEACGISPSDSQECALPMGLCVPHEGAWLCLCDGVKVVDAVAGDTCETAIFAACTEGDCGSEWGGCVLSSELGTYDCECGYYGASRSISSTDCAEALRQACDPSFGCNSFSGFCDMSSTAFSCQCIDGTTAEPTYDSLGHDDCFAAVEQVCGHVEPPQDMSCEDEVGNVRGSCSRVTANTGTYACNCAASSPNSGSAWGSEISADSCELALAQVCFPE